MKMSIIIPAHNYAQYLGECILSCKNQTIPVEIIVVDDASVDETEQIAKKHNVNYIRHQQNWGLSKARNTGIMAATGDKILCLDADDKIHPTYAEKAQDLEGIVVCGVENFGDKQDKVYPYHDLSLESFKVQNRITIGSWFDKKDWERVGGFDENMKEGREDWDFWLSLLERGVKINVIPEFLFMYRLHGVAMAQRADANQEKIHAYIRQKHPKIWPL